MACWVGVLLVLGLELQGVAYPILCLILTPLFEFVQLFSSGLTRNFSKKFFHALGSEKIQNRSLKFPQGVGFGGQQVARERVQGHGGLLICLVWTLAMSRSSIQRRGQMDSGHCLHAIGGVGLSKLAGINIKWKHQLLFCCFMFMSYPFC